MKTYQENKARVREMAIDWQIGASENCYSYGELAYFGEISTAWAVAMAC